MVELDLVERTDEEKVENGTEDRSRKGKVEVVIMRKR